MHRNPWWLTPAGPTLDAGAFLVGLEWASGGARGSWASRRPPSSRPRSRRLAAEAAARGERRAPPFRLAMVGDDVNSDIGGGRRSGLRTVFVRTGKHGDAELAAVAVAGAGAYRAGRRRADRSWRSSRPCPEPCTGRRALPSADVSPAGRVTRGARHPRPRHPRPWSPAAWSPARRRRRPRRSRPPRRPPPRTGSGPPGRPTGPSRPTDAVRHAPERPAVADPRRSQATVCAPSPSRRSPAGDPPATRRAGWANSQRNVSRWPGRRRQRDGRGPHGRPPVEVVGRARSCPAGAPVTSATRPGWHVLALEHRPARGGRGRVAADPAPGRRRGVRPVRVHRPPPRHLEVVVEGAAARVADRRPPARPAGTTPARPATARPPGCAPVSPAIAVSRG